METSQLKHQKIKNKKQQDLAEQRTKNNRKWPKKQGKVHVQLSLGQNVHTPKEVVTF
jgi:hypothetical protein